MSFMMLKGIFNASKSNPFFNLEFTAAALTKYILLHAVKYMQALYYNNSLASGSGVFKF